MFSGASFVGLLALLSVFVDARVISKDELELSIVHFNDVHARFDEVSKSSGPCKPDLGECHGGFARLYSSIMEHMSKRKNPILLDGGDDFQGTLYYNLFKWNITSKFLNLLPVTAHTLGNHEFDGGIKGLIPFMKALKAPVLVSNIDDELEPEFQGLYKKSMVVTVDGKKIGIVGVTTTRTKDLSSPEKLKFLDELESVNKEADRLIEEEGVFTVIVLSHCAYEVDQVMAKGFSKRVSLIVGGHSHTLLYNGTPPDGSESKGPYPTLVPRDVDGNNVLIVQASSYTRYLGDIQVIFSKDGEIISWDGKPIYLGPEVTQDKMIVELLRPWKEQVDTVGNEVLGTTQVNLDADCRIQECNFGNFLADAVVYSYMDNPPNGCWTNVPVALFNAGGIRSEIPIGNITFNDVLIAQPFENTFDSGILQGKHIKTVFEKTTMSFPFNNSLPNVNLLQVSGFKVEYNLSNPKYERVVSLKLRSACSEAYEVLDSEKYYKIGLISFLGKGGDGYSVISDNILEYKKGEMDTDVLRRFVTKESPINIGVEGRLILRGTPNPED